MQNTTSNTLGGKPAAAAIGQTLSSDINDIRSDVQALKDDACALTGDIKSAGLGRVAEAKGAALGKVNEVKGLAVDKVNEVKTLATEKIDSILATSDESLKAIDEEIKANPRSAVAFAFAAGIVASFLLRR